jgi:hypothetical protein
LGDILRSLIGLNLHPGYFLIGFNNPVPDLHRKLQGQAGPFGCYHHLVQVQGFSGKHLPGKFIGLKLKVIYLGQFLP